MSPAPGRNSSPPSWPSVTSVTARRAIRAIWWSRTSRKAGGLRDLHTLFWIAKYYYHVRDTADLVKLGVLSKRELRLFEKADDFLWAVRCQMHFITNKAEERLSFDIQREIADALGYQPRPGLSAVERFMKHYFTVAKDVGDLTRIVCAALEDRQAKDVPGLSGVLSRFAHRVRKIPGSVEFVEDRGRIALAKPDVFKTIRSI